MGHNLKELTAENVVELIRRRRNVSMAEISQHFKDTDGNLDMLLHEENNLVLWGGMSRKFCDVMNEVNRSRKTEITGTCYLSYLHDGMCMKYPVAKSCTRKYKKPRWVPAIFNIRKTSFA